MHAELPLAARLLLTCEHGGNAIPAPYGALFTGAAEVLASHRGWDPGALSVARAVARRCAAPLLEVRVSRLLVDANRSPDHPRVFSAYTRPLEPEGRAALLLRHHSPHHRAASELAKRFTLQGELLHLSIHSFTPYLDGKRRDVDVGILYDPGRPAERRWAGALAVSLALRLPSLRIRRNAPYRGASDGLTKVLRRSLATDRYAGIELEINQRFLVDPPGIKALGQNVARAVADAIASL